MWLLEGHTEKLGLYSKLVNAVRIVETILSKLQPNAKKKKDINSFPGKELMVFFLLVPQLSWNFILKQPVFVLDIITVPN